MYRSVPRRRCTPEARPRIWHQARFCFESRPQICDRQEASMLAPTALFAKPDVRGWRFGVWELQYRYGENYWARCDCGAEQAVGLDKLLSMDALSCDHQRSRGFYCISRDAMQCVCGKNRRFWFNGRGFRTWRCGNCEEKDIRAYLRYEYDDRSSMQFLANMKRSAP